MDLERTEMQIFAEEFEQEIEGQSDRGLVIVGTAGLDFALERLLNAFLNREVDREEMYGPTGPLSELGGRIKMAAALGLISPAERRELERVRKIRNRAAHQIDVNLGRSPLLDHCLQLQLGVQLYVPRRIPLVMLPDGSKGIPPNFMDPTVDLPLIDVRLANSSDPRARFTSSVRVLMRVMAARTMDAPPRSSVPEEFEHPEDPARLTLSHTAVDIREYESSLDELRMMRDQLHKHGSSTEEEDRDIAELEAVMEKLQALHRFHEYCNEVIRRARSKK